MTESEFRDWWSYHCAVFPSFSKWITEANRGLEEKTFVVWYDLHFKAISQEDARAVTDLWAEHPGQMPPYGEHGARVRELAGQYERNRQRLEFARARQRESGCEDLVSCVWCLDRAFCIIDPPEARKRRISELYGVSPEEAARNYPVAVVCICCQPGQHVARHRGEGAWFNPLRHRIHESIHLTPFDYGPHLESAKRSVRAFLEQQGVAGKYQHRSHVAVSEPVFDSYFDDEGLF